MLARFSDCLAVRRDQRSSAHQSVYRVGQLIFRLVESAFRLHRITGAGLVNRERLFFGFNPPAGGIKDRNFCLCHGLIIVGPEIDVGTVTDRLVPALNIQLMWQKPVCYIETVSSGSICGACPPLPHGEATWQGAASSSQRTIAGIAGRSRRCHPLRLPARLSIGKPASSQIDGAGSRNAIRAETGCLNL